MNSVMYSVLAFIVAIGVLVTVHEFGHFWVARRLGVKVLRFSVGFGQPLWKRTFGPDATELVVASVPLGGYVKMLDEREGHVAVAELPRAFNRQPLSSRCAIVAAGPLFNFLFAICAYWLMYVVGVPGMRPIVGEVVPGSYADLAGIDSGDEIVAIAGVSTPTWESAVLALLDASLENTGGVDMQVRGAQGGVRQLQARFATGSELLQAGGVLENFGVGPWRPPAVIDRLVAGGAGERAGLQPGDTIIAADDTDISSWEQWVEYVRERPEQAIVVRLLREGREITLDMVPERVTEDAGGIGRIGAYVRLPSDEQRATMRVVVRHGPVEAISQAARKTWEVTTLTLRTLWKMVTGQASVESLSGPISIAQYAGQSAAVGLAAFLGFLGIVSVSLGVLNLLPVPVLDGGHLLFYVVEFIKGAPMSEAAQLLAQKIGIALLLALMTLAFYNDLVRLFD